ncbi:HlyD family efflux transporter periplasmic adaptor subunit [Methylobacter tundripaludum]|uniref:Secretion protein HlyD family protein n=1 Tax=Methylobacter tundripaludum (strain ATCC BAA-1195 / DSM 17260 / SV96) TaxID=697282 RepID=G3IZM7_METTV|nr:biotin/lipoyl-binding protein [Methylobacter tundripaludum]EGW20399.1 secretion protein HlyD family protein [Methylobacter tundripaludum SV96]
MENSQTDNHAINFKRRMMLGRIIGTLIVLGALLTGALVWRINYQHPRTNDAMVRANIVGIAPEVSGRIVELHVEDNQYVKQGDLLYVIDPRPYQAKLAQAKAELLVAEKDVDSRRASSGSAELAIERLEHQRAAAEAEVSRIEAEDEYLHSYLERLEPLAEKQYVTADQLKQARSKYAASRAELADARAKELSARSAIDEAKSDSRRAVSLIAQVGNVNARIEAAKAVVAAAELDVEYCSVRAPFDAYVTNLNTREGEYAKTGTQMFALVDDRHWYAIANFKETYLQSIRPGQEADVFLIGYPGKRYRGVVTGIGWANYPDNIKQQGVLPEVQRTLNWVILASRFPVRIEIHERDPEHPLRMGMTAFVTVLDRPAEIPGLSPATEEGESKTRIPQ